MKFILFVSALFCFQLVSAQQIQPGVLEKAMGSVVTVAVYESDAATKTLGFKGENAEMAYSKALDLTGVEGTGSGFVVKQNGKTYIVTNAHVIQMASDKQGSISVFSINYTKYPARLVGGDSYYDVAVLELLSPAGAEITPIDFRKGEILIGEQVYAIGNPLGEYPYTITSGIISAKNRVRGGLTGKFGFLQSSATVIWGNSGGPLVDVNGKVVGINSQIAFAENGGQTFWQPQINFALESAIANRLVNDIINNNGLIKRSYIGLTVVKNFPTDNSSVRKMVEGSGDIHPLISGVIPGSPAEKYLAGHIGYSIVSVNGESVRNAEEVLGQFEKTAPGTEIVFVLEKSGVKKTVKFKTATADASTTADIAQHITNLWGSSAMTDQSGLVLNFNDRNKYAAYHKSVPENLTVLRSTNTLPAETLLNKDWLVVACGILSKSGNQVWQTRDLTDLGAALRLTGMSGVVDLVLFRKGTNPSTAANYVQKRFVLSGNTASVAQTLWY